MTFLRWLKWLFTPRPSPTIQEQATVEDTAAKATVSSILTDIVLEILDD